MRSKFHMPFGVLNSTLLRKTRGRTRDFQPRLESLEDRRMMADLSYAIQNVPDFDQRRADDPGIDGLPNDGSMYCVPTSAINWMAYIANHGYPNVGPGPGDWQQQSHPFFTDKYNAISNTIEVMGALMGTHPQDGTKGAPARSAMRTWLSSAYPFQFVVSRYGKGHIGNALFDDLADSAAAGNLIMPGVGWYSTIEKDLAKAVENDDMTQSEADSTLSSLQTIGVCTSCFYRAGGHVFSLVEAKIAGESQTMGFHDPGTDNSKTSQSTFSKASKAVITEQDSFDGVFRTLSRVVDYGSARIDGYFAIRPKFGLTVTNNQFKFFFPVQLAGSNQPKEQFASADGKIMDAVLHPERMLHPYLVEGDNRVRLLDSRTGSSSRLAPVEDPQRLIVGGPEQNIFVLGARQLARLSRDGEVELNARLLSPLEAIAYDDASNQIVGYSRDANELVFFDRNLRAARTPVKVPLDPPPREGGKLTLNIAPSDGSLWFFREGSAVLTRVRIDDRGQARASEIRLAVRAPEGMTIDENDLLYVSDGGRLKVFDASGNPVDSPFNGQPGGSIVRILSSFDNFDPETESTHAYHNVLPDDAEAARTHVIRTGDVLTVLGNGEANEINLVDDGARGVQVSIDQSTATYLGIRQIVVSAMNGDDIITYEFVGDSRKSVALHVDGGGGDDVLWMPADPAGANPNVTIQSVQIQSSLIVNTDNDVDDGVCNLSHCSLREAINTANALSGYDTIRFRIPGPGPHTIQPASALPTVTGPVFIDGYSEPGSTMNTLPISSGSNATIMIEVNGGLITDGSSGLVITGGSSTVRGLSVTQFAYPDLGDPGSPENVPVGGIVLLGGGNRVFGNFIGVDPNGTTAEGNNFYGIFVSSSHNQIGGPLNSQRNLISGNQGIGIQLTGRDVPSSPSFTPTEFNRIQGNLIGTDRTGSVALPNTGAGIVFRLHARNNLIGGDQTNLRNIISGNGGPFAPFGDPNGPYQDWPDAPYPLDGGHGTGVHIANLTVFTQDFPVPNLIQGNYIGTNAQGTASLPNLQGGISTGFTNNVTIGGQLASGLCTGECNLISGNAQWGIGIANFVNKPSNAIVQGNFIGTDRTGTQPIGNGEDGVIMLHSEGSLVGGDSPGKGNLIAFNGRNGVLHRGHPNWVNPSRNTIRFNSIHSNAALGIDLDNSQTFGDGPTLNDPGDVDDGPNSLQNFPVLASAVFGPTTFVAGMLNSLALTRFVLDFYVSATADPTGFGEGRRHLGSLTVLTDSNGNASFNGMLAGGSQPGDWVTSTATRLDSNNLPTDTSEFSKALAALDAGQVEQDWGDAPSQYPTTLANDGARHIVDAKVYLGLGVDSEADGQPSFGADGDDLQGADDEDGVTLVTPMVSSAEAKVIVVSSTAAKLDAWIDFNQDGVWSANERIIASQPTSSGNNTFSFIVPAGAFPTPTRPSYARFRLSTSGGLSPMGLAPDGEVEDYAYVKGNLNGDLTVDHHDLAVLRHLMETGSSQGDLDGNGVTDDADLDYLVHDILATYYGDANLDGRFDTGDLVKVFAAGEYEDSLANNSRWATGDWNLNGDFDTGDLVKAFTDGGFEKPALAKVVATANRSLLDANLIASGSAAAVRHGPTALARTKERSSGEACADLKSWKRQWSIRVAMDQRPA